MSSFQKIASAFSVIFLLCVFFEYTSAEPSKDYSNICTNHPPTKTSKTNNESKWSYEDKGKERHIPFASKNARARLGSLLLGKVVDDTKEDYAKMCPAALVDYLQGHVEINLYGYGSKKADYVCVVMEGNTGGLDCAMKHSNGYTLKVVTYPHYEDRVLTTTWCFEDGEVGWIVWTTHDDLTAAEEKKTMEYLTSIGFDTTDKVAMTDPSCTNKFS